MPVFTRIWCFLTTIWIAEGTIIYSAQCRSRCYTLYKGAKDQGKLKQCLSPCLQDYAKLGSCREFCSPWGDDNAPCHYSCKDYKRLYISDYGSGTCSSKKIHSYEYCDRNVRCDELRKCCVKTNMCEDVVAHGEEITVTVSQVTSSSLIARWQASNVTGAVYIIQLREVVSRTIYYTEHDWTAWEQKLQGQFTGVKFSGFPSGVRVQLRVAIVNRTGLQSIGAPTPVIRTLFNASRPSGLEGLWVMRKQYKGTTVSVTFGWTPPAILDVPVHSYRIYWKQIPLITSDLAVLTKKRTRVDGSQYNYTIENLKPDTTYNVEFEAICIWKTKRLKSPKVGINISTGHIKDHGKGIIDIIFNKSKSGKVKENKNQKKYFDDIKNIDVLVEKEQDQGTHAPSEDPNKSTYNSARRQSPTLWLKLICLSFLSSLLALNWYSN